MDQRSAGGPAASNSGLAGLAIVDAHQHFWDPATNYHPWLCDEPPISFRYGDYRSIRRRYLPPDYLADAEPIRVDGTVYVETEWDPADPIGETRYVEQLRGEYGLPTVVVAQASLDQPDAANRWRGGRRDAGHHASHGRRGAASR